jgi:hypothetical protein
LKPYFIFAGFALCGLGIIMLYGTMLVFKIHYPEPDEWILLTESITGFGLGGSVIAMFGRVGGGIYTKAADVGTRDSTSSAVIFSVSIGSLSLTLDDLMLYFSVFPRS